jgi:AcrR family transcriptional regulator
MAQYLKDEIEQAIRAAALREFAAKGYLPATMADIAASAGISTGNLYRYFAGKEALFHAVIDDAFVARLKRLLRARVRTARGVSDPLKAERGSEYGLAAEAVVSFCIEHRLKVVVVLGRADGSRHAGLAAELVRELSVSAIAHARAARNGFEPTRALRFNLDYAYARLVGSTVAILAEFTDEAELRDAMIGYGRYHLAGLGALLGL